MNAPATGNSAAIKEALRHFPGIGPTRLQQLQAAGIHSWDAILALPDLLPRGLRDRLRAEADRCLAALAADDIAYFVEQLAPEDRWRILTLDPARISYFDIETLGLEAGSPITMIACWHRDELRLFFEHENLDDFLDLLDDVRLLVSFNGNSFDVPRVLDTFHIPRLPCPHLDLRWTCHHRGWRGGLKEITARLGIERPLDLMGIDGLWAVDLWLQWRRTQDVQLREKLARYGGADVLLLLLLADRLTDRSLFSPSDLWAKLPTAQHVAPPRPKLGTAVAPAVTIPGVPQRWRALGRRANSP